MTVGRRRIKKFQNIVWNFYIKNKRNFPWRRTKNAYRILVSEVMLQQTQADRVVAYYQKFIRQFPDMPALAQASFAEVYGCWQGLGYNRRAKALLSLAQEVIGRYDGKLPREAEALESLPGIGPYTARAVAIFAWNMPLICIETNIRRVFLHHFFGDQEGVGDEQIAPLALAALEGQNSRQWHWALMDYGAHLKTGMTNPNRRHKEYRLQAQFEGSRRQARGAIMRQLSAEPSTAPQLAKRLAMEQKRIKEALAQLIKEGLVQEKRGTFSLP